MNSARSGDILVSAIVSTYNAERFIRGKLEDLEAQTIAQELEIIVIDSGSEQNERAIVERFQRQYANIRYLRTGRRETVYQAWNRGIREARGEFVTNANTDDRLRRDCYQTLVRALRERPDCVLAYGDMRITGKENVTFDHHESFGFRRWDDFDRLALLELCCVGPFPLWRRSLHDEIGYFDERFTSAADYEFWLRAALRHDFIHVPEFVGLYWLNDKTVSRKGELPTLEYLEVQKEYRPKYAPLTSPPEALQPPEEEEYREIMTRITGGSMGLREVESFAQRHPRSPQVQHDLAELYLGRNEIGLAKKHFEKAAILDPGSSFHQEKLQAFLRTELYQSLKLLTGEAAAAPGHLETQLTAGMVSIVLERWDTAREYYRRALDLDPECAVARENLAYLERRGRLVSDGNSAASRSSQDLTSIIILTTGSPECTKECLERIAEHTPEPHEVIVVEVEPCGAVAPPPQFSDGGYRIIGSGGERGFAAWCEVARKVARGKRILLMENDVVVTPGWLGALIESLHREGPAAIVGPMTNETAGAQRAAGTNYRTIQELEDFSAAFTAANAGRRLPVDALTGFCLLFNRDLLDALQRWEPALGAEKLDAGGFCFSAALAGYHCVVAGELFVHHYGSERGAENVTVDPVGVSAAGTPLPSGCDLGRLDEAQARHVVTQRALVTGRRLARQGRLNDAVDLLLREGIGFSPKAPRPYLVLAEVLAEAGEYRHALEVLGEIPAGEEMEKIHLQALCRHNLGELPQVRELTEQGLTMEPQSPRFLSLMGIVAAERGRADQAEEHFRRAIEADPGYGPSYSGLGRMLWERGDHEEGLKCAERGFVLSPLSMAALDLFHRYATALDAAPSPAGDSGEGDAPRLMLLREEQRVREARAVYPEHKGLAYGLIENLIRQRRFGEAMDEIERSAVAFGLDDATIDAALEIRTLAGAPAPAVRGTGSLSVCMIVKDEAKRLPAALLSVKGLAGEVIVVDTGSTDRSTDVARLFGARVFSFPWNDSFADARNFSLSKAAGDWIMVLDADEALAPSDIPPLTALLSGATSPTAYSFTTRNYTTEVTRKNWTPNSGEYRHEERGSGWTPSEKVRLFPNDSRIGFEGAVHELLELSLVRCGIPIHACDIPVHHYGRLDAARNAEKQERYYHLGLRKMEESGESIEALVELAVQATELKRFEEAERLWRRVLQERPQSGDAYFNLGYIQLAAGKYREARIDAAKAVELSPGMKEAAFNLAKCDFFLGNLAAALSCCKALLQTCPDYPPALSLLCAVLLAMGRSAEATTAIERLGRMRYDCLDFLLEYAEGVRKGERADLAAPLLALAATLEGNPAPEGAAAGQVAEGCRDAL